MRKLLNKAGLNFNSSAELEAIIEIKEKLCYVALDYEAETQGTILFIKPTTALLRITRLTNFQTVKSSPLLLRGSDALSLFSSP